MNTVQGRFPYQALVKYPHLKPEDVLSWVLFMEQNPEDYDSVDYDFALGDVSEHAQLAMELQIPGVEKLNQYKVDVVAYAPHQIDIIELKGKATISAMGQILAYKNLYDREHNPTVPTRAVVIAREATPDLERIFLEHNVELILV